jgi:putative transposase
MADSGATRSAPCRAVLDALFYLLRTGCPSVPGRYLPSNFPPWQTVYYHVTQFCRTGLWTCLYRALREAERRRVGRDPDPSAAIVAIMDAQRVKTVEESGRLRGYADGTPTSVSKAASASCWWRHWDCRSWSM